MCRFFRTTQIVQSIFKRQHLMNLNLTKPICFFDLETTGVNISKDRIVEISILKVFPNGKEETKTWLVNPEMPILKNLQKKSML